MSAEVKMPYCKSFHELCLKDLFSKLNNLKTVDVSECKNGVTDMSVTTLAHNNPNLKYLAMKKCEMITGESLKTLAEKCPQLEHISMDECHQGRD